MTRLFGRKSIRLWVDPVTSAIIVAYIIGSATAFSFGMYAFKEGELTRTYPVSYETAWNAASAALDALEMTVLEKKRDDEERGTIAARREDNTDVIIKVKYITEESTRVGVRVGLPVTSGRISLGDKKASTKIHEAIQRKF